MHHKDNQLFDMDKSILRKEMKAKNLALTPRERADLSDAIFRHIESLPEFRDAHTIAVFESLPDEPDTAAALARWAAEGKRIVLPRIVDWGACHMTFDIPPTEIDLFVVPGVAFTPSGHRLGRGKGFYDRYLHRSSAPKIGICYPHQLIPSLPTEPHDILMDQVVYNCPSLH